MDRRRRRYVLTLLAASLVIAFAAFARAEGSGETIPTYSVKITPNWIHPTYGGVNHNAVWIYPQSPTTPYRSPDSEHQQTRYLLLDPRATDSDGRRGNDEWWFVIERLWPADYPADNHGKWGREVDFHNVAGDSGPAGSGGVGWGFGSGVSALALDWRNGAPSPSFSVEPMDPNNNYPLPSVQRDEWHTYVVHWIAGRTDGTTVRPGLLQVWVDGSDTPAIDARNINTVQRAQASDGNWYVQKWTTLWEGDYTMDIPVASQTRFALTRIGKTLAEAIDDRPSVAGDNVNGQYYRGQGVNLGAPDADNTGDRSASAAAIPSSLGSTPAPPAAPVSTAAPTISGTAQAGQTLTASNGSWNGSPTGYAYQWQRCNTSGGACAALSGATSSTYAVTTADVGATLRIDVKATNAGGTTSASSQPTATVTAAPQARPTSPAAPVNTKLPTIKGKADLGRTLTASNGSWNGNPTSYAYQWQRCNTSGDACGAVEGATGQDYAVGDADLGATLRVEVKATNGGGATAAVSDPTETVAKPGGGNPKQSAGPKPQTDPAPSKSDGSASGNKATSPESPKTAPQKSEPPTAPTKGQSATPVAGPDKQTVRGNSTDAAVRWNGKTFRTKSELRDDLVRQGLDWEDFLRRHPALVDAFEMPYVGWNHLRFFDDRDLGAYLGTLGVPWFVWAANHPLAAVMLAAQRQG